MHDDPSDRLRRYHAALQPYRRALLEGMFAPDAVYISAGVAGRIEGRAAILDAFDAYFGRFPDQIAQDDEVRTTGPHEAVAHWRLIAHDAGDGRETRRSGRETVRFDPAGRILSVVVEDD
jgi:hypothetical protein